MTRPIRCLLTVVHLPVLLGATSTPPVSAPSPTAEPHPPTLHRSLPSPPIHRAAHPAAGATAWVIADLSDEEQVLVERINRARADPSGEVLQLYNLPDPDAQGAYQGFGVDFSLFAADMATRPVAPPLTPQPQLTAAARRHSQYQLDNAVQSHDEVDFATGTVLNGIGERVTAEGYPWTTLRESVFAFAANMEHAHAGFEVDWGNGPGGQQSPPGHRENNHAPEITEIGAGVLVGTRTQTHGTNVTTVGPRVVTLDFGAAEPRQNYVTGVAYFDLNENGQYDAGEGLPEVQVDVSGAGYFARTTPAGGYGIPAADGPRSVTFSGTALPPVTRSVTLAGASVKVDLALPYVAPRLLGTATPSIGVPNDYQTEAFPNATGYSWRAVRRVPFTQVLGAENGLDGMVATTTGTYTPRTTTSHATGSACYRLVLATADPQGLTQPQELVAQAGATLRFQQRFGVSTDTSVATAEVSTDGGTQWQEVWSRHGLGDTTPPEATFRLETVTLPLAAGTVFQVRFRYRVIPGGYYFNSESDLRVGFFLDAVAYSGVSENIEAGGGEVVAGNLVRFTPTQSGQHVLQCRPRVQARAFPFREGITVTAQVAPPPTTAVTRIGAVTTEATDRLRIPFTVLSGTATTFDLERTAALGGPWTRDVGALLATNAAGQFSFVTGTASAEAGFLRIRAR